MDRACAERGFAFGASNRPGAFHCAGTLCSTIIIGVCPAAWVPRITCGVIRISSVA